VHDATEEPDPLGTILGDRTIGAASKLAFYQLYKLCGWKLGVCLIRLDWLGTANGRDARSALDWLRELEKHGLISTDQRDKRRGTLRVWVLSLHPGDQERKPDPQLRLPFTVGPGVASEQASSARRGFCAETPAQTGVYVNPGRGLRSAYIAPGFLRRNPGAATVGDAPSCDNSDQRAGVLAQKPRRAHDHDYHDNDEEFIVVMNSVRPDLAEIERRAREAAAAAWPNCPVDEKLFYLLVRTHVLVEHVWPDRERAEEWLRHAIAVIADGNGKFGFGYFRRCLQYGCFDILGLCRCRSQSQEFFERALLVVSDTVRPLMDAFRAAESLKPPRRTLAEELREQRRKAAKNPLGTTKGILREAMAMANPEVN